MDFLKKKKKQKIIERLFAIDKQKMPCNLYIWVWIDLTSYTSGIAAVRSINLSKDASAKVVG